MRFSKGRSARAALVGMALAHAGCGLLLGLDEFQDAEPTVGSGGAAGATSSAAGGGGSRVCEPGTVEACPYGGPPMTEGVGQCVAASRTCLEDGSGYGECAGEVVPGTEDCIARGDEDCDGNPCSDALWSRMYGGPDNQNITSIAIDPVGNVLVAGLFSNRLKIGDRTLIASGQSDYFLAKLDAAGQLQWAQKFGDASDNGDLIKVAVGRTGNIAVTGNFHGTINLGGDNLTSAGDVDMFIGMFDTDGAHQWSKRIGTTTAITGGQDIAIDSRGNIFIAGFFSGTVSFGGTSFTSRDIDIFLARFAGDAAGTHQWSHTISDIPGQPAGLQSATSMKLDSSDNIILTGTFTNSINFGTFLSLTTSTLNSFIAKLDAVGNATWTEKLDKGTIRSVAVDSIGQTIIAGVLSDAINFGTPVGTLTPKGSADAFIAKYTTTGSISWARSIGGAGGTADGIEIAVDHQDDIILTGWCSGSVDLGYGLTSAPTASDLFVIKHDTAGSLRWGKRYLGENVQYPFALAVDSSTKAIVVGGAISGGSIDFGDGQLTYESSGGFDDIVMAKLAP